MKKITNMLLAAALALSMAGDGTVQMMAKKAVLESMEYNNQFTPIIAGPNEEEGHLSIFCRDENVVSAELYTSYGEGKFSLQGTMEGTEGSLPFPEEGSSVDFYILANFGNKEAVKSNIVTFCCEEGYYYEITKDSDGDGLPDGYEVRDLGTDPKNADTDGDGLSDGYEVQMLHTDPLEMTKNSDYDGDGMKNREEFEKGTNPWLWDTDFDGTSDKKDKMPLTNMGETAVREEQLPSFKMGYYDVKETFQEEDGTWSEVVTNIINRNVQWVKTGGSYTRYFYDFESAKPTAELTYHEETDGYTVTQLTYSDKRLTNINQNGSTKEITYAENGQVSGYYEDGELLYEKQYDGGLVSEIVYGNGDTVSYNYNQFKEMTGMEMNSKKAYSWKYSNRGVVSQYVDEREGTTENRSYDDWFELTDRTQDGGLSVSYSIDGNEASTIYRAEGEEKEIVESQSVQGSGEDRCTIKYPQDVEITTFLNGEGQKTISQSGTEIVNPEKSKKQIEKAKKEEQKKEKENAKKAKSQQKQAEKAEKQDKIGNRTKKGNVQYDWEGLQLKTCEQDGETAEYAYDSDGNRIKKTVNGITTTYGIDEGKIIYEKTGEETTWYYYGADSLPAAFEKDGEMYLYEKDGEGDVIALYNTQGEAVTEYLYDESGSLLEITGNQELGEANPFRFQSAYYDGESGLYYSCGRYYDTETTSFLNSDSLYEAEPEKEETYLSASYYGAAVEGANGATYAAPVYVYATPVKGLLSPSGNNRLYSWSQSCLKYNCYTYALGKADQIRDPGEISGQYSMIDFTNLYDIRCRILADLKSMGYTPKVVNAGYTLRSNEQMIAVKLLPDGWDYHFMRYMKSDGTWRHKPGITAILTYQKSLENAWMGESYSVKEYKWSTNKDIAYNSSTLYIVYAKTYK